MSIGIIIGIVVVVVIVLFLVTRFGKRRGVKRLGGVSEDRGRARVGNAGKAASGAIAGRPKTGGDSGSGNQSPEWGSSPSTVGPTREGGGRGRRPFSCSKHVRCGWEHVFVPVSKHHLRMD